MMVLTSNYRKRIFNFKHWEFGSIKLEDVEVEYVKIEANIQIEEKSKFFFFLIFWGGNFGA